MYSPSYQTIYFIWYARSMVGKHTSIYCEWILESINQIEVYVFWKTEDDFLNDQLLIDWCLMQLQHIWETVVQISKVDYNFVLFEKENIIWFRNLVSHQYRAVRAWFIWTIIKTKLPLLKREIEKKLLT